MKIDNVKVYTPQFQALNYSRANISDKIIEGIENSPALKNFAKKYNADLAIQYYMPANQPEILQFGLSIENIKPSNVLQKIVDFFKSNKPIFLSNTLSYNSEKLSEEAFVSSLRNLDSDFFVNIYRNV